MGANVMGDGVSVRGLSVLLKEGFGEGGTGLEKIKGGWKAYEEGADRGDSGATEIEWERESCNAFVVLCESVGPNLGRFSAIDEDGVAICRLGGREH
jgi:hypothetical protein